MFLKNANDLQIKQLADCFVTGNTFDNIEDEHANNEEDVGYDDVGNIIKLDIPANHEDHTKYIYNTRSISSTRYSCNRCEYQETIGIS